MDLGFFVVMGVIGGLLGATFNCLNKRLAKYRMRNVHPKPKLVRYLQCTPCGWPPLPGKMALCIDPASHSHGDVSSEARHINKLLSVPMKA